MRIDATPTIAVTSSDPVASAGAGEGAPAGPRQAAAGAIADEDADRVVYIDIVSRWFVAAMGGGPGRAPSGRARRMPVNHAD